MAEEKEEVVDKKAEEKQRKKEEAKQKKAHRLILDRYSAEIFVNDGEHVLTATLYTDLEADGISFFADGKVEMDVTRYELRK